MMRLILLVFALLSINAYGDAYEFGEGVNIPNTPIYIGGYATLDYVQRADDYKRFRVDELGLMAYGGHERFSFMAALEMKESYVHEWDLQEEISTTDKVSVERLYIDYEVSDAIKIRAGKFNTPAGYWNMEPINILRDTSSVPYSTYLLYPRYTTGLEFHYADSFSSNTEYAMIVQETQGLDDYYNNIEVDRHYLAGVEHFFSDAFKMKANVGYFETYNDEPYLYTLLALSYESENFDILSELGNRRDSKTYTVPYSFYLQGTWHINEANGLVARFETYAIDEGAQRDENINVLGYVYRPDFPFTFKIEYRDHSYRNENQIRSSVSLMF